ncbi:molecular chaperone HtpG [Candidatus Gracilibacteria bacterium]|nr:molecular chaperone HtpG [Candidatus Gracilibacteria bacterium]
MSKKQHNFEAETGRILELLTHSIYSNKEIFLRELISNASDAIDKARLKALTDTSFLGDDTHFEIKIEIDKEAKTLSVIDNGIGMTEEEIHKHIGTIAKSGTKEFLEKLEKAKEGGDHNLIGQFGVGFYSAFMVAESIDVVTRSGLDTKAHIWSSDGKSSYELEETQKEGRGTKVVLHLSEGNHELLEDWKIRELIKKYSNYVRVPVMMLEEVDKEGATQETGLSGDRSQVESKWVQVNETQPIWKKSKTSIKAEEYKEFYQSVSMDFNAPLGHVHNSVEGKVSYTSLLYIPEATNAFSDMRDPAKEYGPKLYVQSVLILDHAKELLPVWLRFVSGVVETTDLPLNISREMLQSNATLETIKKSLIKKVLGELKKLRTKNPEGYKKFFENYGSILKEGVYYEQDLKQEIAEVLEFDTLLGDKKISLDEYLEKMQSLSLDRGEDSGGSGENKGKTIYYVTGKSRAEVLASPYLAQFTENKTDVLLLTDSIDEWMIGVLDEYKEVKLKSITANDVKLKEETEEEKKKSEETGKQYKDMLELVKNTIGTDKIENVVLNKNLGDALGALKTPDGAMNPQMEKMMKAMGQPVPETKRILELNPENKLVKAMQKEFKADLKSQKLKDLTSYAYMQAILLEGGELENISDFVGMTNKFAGEYLK